MTMKSAFFPLMQSVLILQGCAVFIHDVDSHLKSNRRLDAPDSKIIAYHLTYESYSGKTEDSIAYPSRYPRKGYHDYAAFTGIVLREMGYDGKLVIDSNAADLLIAIDNYWIQNTFLDWACGLSLGLIPSFGKYTSRKIQFDNLANGKSEIYTVESRYLAHLLLFAPSLVQFIGAEQREQDRFRKSLVRFMTKR